MAFRGGDDTTFAADPVGLDISVGYDWATSTFGRRSKQLWRRMATTPWHFSENQTCPKSLTSELHASICPLFPSVHPCVHRLVQTDALDYLRYLHTKFELCERIPVLVCVFFDPRSSPRPSGAEGLGLTNVSQRRWGAAAWTRSFQAAAAAMQQSFSPPRLGAAAI